MATSYAQWSLAELEKEKARIEKAIERKSGQEKSKVRAQLAALAKKSGFKLAELIDDDGSSTKSATHARKRGPAKASKAKGRKVPPKYRHPDDKTLTWTGRGRTPLWMVEFEKQGKARDEFLIK